MKPSDIQSGAQRAAIVGLVWEEIQAMGAGPCTDEAKFQQSYRVAVDAGAGDVTVTLDGINSLTILPGTVEVFNVGMGLSDNQKRTVTVVITAAAGSFAVSRQIVVEKRSRIQP